MTDKVFDLEAWVDEYKKQTRTRQQNTDVRGGGSRSDTEALKRLRTSQSRAQPAGSRLIDIEEPAAATSTCPQTPETRIPKRSGVALSRLTPWQVVLGVSIMLAILGGCLLEVREYVEPPSGSIARPFAQLPVAHCVTRGETQFHDARGLVKKCTDSMPKGCPLSDIDFVRLTELGSEAASSAEQTFINFQEVISDFCTRRPSGKNVDQISWFIDDFQQESARTVLEHSSTIARAKRMKEILEREDERLEKSLKTCSGARSWGSKGNAKECTDPGVQQDLITRMELHLRQGVEAYQESLSFWIEVETLAGWMQGNASHSKRLMSREDELGIEASRLVFNKIEEMWRRLIMDRG